MLVQELLQQILETQREQGELLAAATTTVSSMNRQLFGNGQPGVIKELQTKIEVVERTASDELTRVNAEVIRLDKKFVWFGGATSGIAWTIAIGTKFLFNKLGWWN